MNLLTTHELKEFLRLKSDTAAKKMANRLGIKPISFGHGRGLGDRWVKEEVEKALHLLRDGVPKSQIETKRPRRGKTSDFLRGRVRTKRKTLHNLFFGGSPMNYKKISLLITLVLTLGLYGRATTLDICNCKGYAGSGATLCL